MESWRIVLEPIFNARRYPGSFYRGLDYICAVQSRSNGSTTIYLGAWGMSKHTGMEIKWCRQILRRIEADELLHRVEHHPEGGRIKGDERPGAPGKATGYELGRAAFENRGLQTPVRDPENRGLQTPVRTPKNGLKQGSTDPRSNRGLQTPPISTRDFVPRSYPMRGGMEGGEKDGAEQARRTTETLSAPNGNGWSSVGQILRTLTATSAQDRLGQGDQLDVELRSRVAVRRRRSSAK